MTAAWMAGYVSDVAYTLGFYRELAPSFLDFVCTTSGVDGLKQGRRLRYCELGCGRGYGTTLLAAANPDIEFVGIDFNPAHVDEARTLAAEAELDNVRFVEASFADAAKDPGLGEFDVVALHGVYTWVDAAVRRDIVDFIRTRLVSGGIAYVSYNTLPGWAVMTPIQHLLRQFTQRGSGDTLSRLKRAIGVVGQIGEANAAYVTQNPGVKARIDGLARQDLNYLTHEFLHESWEPIYVTEAFRDFAEAKLTYVGSAGLTENRTNFAVPEQMLAMVDAAPDPAMRELLKDYAVNKQFRRDVYVKGPSRLPLAQAKQKWAKTSFHRLTTATTYAEVWPIPAGQVTLKPALVQAVTEPLAKGPASGARLVEAVTKAGFSEDEAYMAVDVLMTGGVIAPGRRLSNPVDRAPSHRLNRAIMRRAAEADTHRYLAAPAIGSAINASFLERLTMPLFLEDGAADAATIVDRAFALMEANGRSMSRDGKPLTRDEAAGIAPSVEEIRAKAMPVCRELGVID